MAVKQYITSSVLVKTGYSRIIALLIGTDGTNDPVVTVYDDTSNTAGTEAIPTCTYDASALGLNGAIFGRDGAIECQVGIYVEISNLGTGEVILYYN